MTTVRVRASRVREGDTIITNDEHALVTDIERIPMRPNMLRITIINQECEEFVLFRLLSTLMTKEV